MMLFIRRSGASLMSRLSVTLLVVSSLLGSYLSSSEAAEAADTASALNSPDRAIIAYTPELKQSSAFTGLPANLLELSPRAAEAADLLKVRPYVEYLFKMRREGLTKPGLADKRVTALKLNIYHKMAIGALEVRKCTARIDRELAYAYDIEASVSGRRNKLVARTNTINFLQFGVLGAIRTGMLMNSHTSHAMLDSSNYIRSTTSGIGVVLTSLTFMEMKSGKRKIDTDPNSLAGIYSIESARPLYLPGMVWTFLNSTPPEIKNGVSRREILLKQWLSLRKLDPANLPRIHSIAATPQKPDEETESIRTLNDRIFMLHDLHAMIEQLDFEIYELSKVVSGDSAPPGLAPYGVTDQNTNGPVDENTTKAVHGATLNRSLEQEGRTSK
jgi:hypothetical protein